MFPQERLKCCQGGTRVLDEVDNPPIRRKEREILETAGMSHYSRIINSLLSFAVIGTTPTERHGGRGLRSEQLPGRGPPPVFTLHGRTYHMWVPPSDHGPARGYTLPDVFLLDRIDTLSNRPRGMALLSSWRRYLRSNHPLARTLAHSIDYNRRRGSHPISVSVAPSTAVSAEMEIALVYPDTEAGPPGRFAIPFPLAGDPDAEYRNTFVPDTSALYDVMHYPLLHPRGMGGFNQPATTSRRERNSYIRHSAASRVVYAAPQPDGSRHQFTLFQWAKANLFQNPRLHHHGRLMQEWALNQYSRFVHDDLEFRRHKARTTYFAPMHAVRQGPEAIRNARRRVYLSSKVVGSKRYLDGKVADAMAVVQASASGSGVRFKVPVLTLGPLPPPPPLPRLQALGKPTYFITFTANPNWPEIRQLLTRRQNPGDRADAVMRVFKIKLQALLDDLRAGESLGSPSVFIFYVIEFQKRGLPHAHSE